jgi:anti-sigma regulatory factor (Ser/Thr protein kinase)
MRDIPPSPPDGTTALCLQLRYPSHRLDLIDEYENTWRQFIRSTWNELPTDRADSILLACREATLNAMEHGCGKSPDKTCDICFRLDKHKTMLAVHVTDDGPGIPPEALNRSPEDAQPLRPRGRGLILIRCLAQCVIALYNPSRLIMHFAVQHTPQEDTR